MAPLHFGELHRAEGFLVLLLALGPMAVCIATVLFLRWKGDQGQDASRS